MANTQYITANRLSAEASDAREKVLKYGTPLTIVLIVVFPTLWWWFSAALLIIFLNAGSIKRAGAAGEDATQEILSSLPDSYTLFNQVQIPNEKSKTGYTEIDFIIVGPNGVFVVEVKNNNSKIVGSEEEKTWTVHKVGRKGTPYTSSMRNPIKQLKSQVWVISNYMKGKGINVWFEGIVFFSNNDSELVFNGKSSVPLFHLSGLTEYLESYTPKFQPKNHEKVINELVSIKSTYNA